MTFLCRYEVINKILYLSIKIRERIRRAVSQFCLVLIDPGRSAIKIIIGAAIAGGEKKYD